MAGKTTYARAPWTVGISRFLPFFLQFINTAISEDVMTVNNLLESSIAEVKILSLDNTFCGSSC